MEISRRQPSAAPAHELVAARFERALKRASSAASLDRAAKVLSDGLDAVCVLFFFAEIAPIVRPVGMWTSDPERRAALARYIAARPDADRETQWHVVRRGEPVLVARDTPESLAALIPEPQSSLIRRSRAIALLTVPVLCDGEVVGAIMLGRHEGERPLTTEDKAALEQIARQTSGAFAAARRATLGEIVPERRSDGAGALIATLLPQLIDAMTEGVWATDSEGITTFVNAAACRMLARPPEELVGRPYLDFVAERERDASRRRFARQSTEPRRRFPGLLVRADGAEIDVTLRVLRFDGGGILPPGNVALLSDVTRAVEATSVAAAAFEGALDAMLAMDAAGTILDANPAAEELYGYRRHELIGRSALDSLCPPEEREAQVEHLGRMLEAPERITGERREATAVRADGSRLTVEFSVSVVPGQIVRLVASVRDATERLRAEEEQRARAAANAAVADLSRRALEGAPRDVLLRDATAIVREALRADSVEVWERLPETRAVVRRAASGWAESERAMDDDGVLLARPLEGPVVIEDPAAAGTIPDEWTANNATTAVLCPVPSPDGAPFGTLAVAYAERHAVPAHEVSFAEMIAHVLGTVYERERLEVAKRWEALHDRLTGLPNRVLLTDRLGQAISRIRRDSPVTAVGVLVLDLDRFNEVINSFGSPDGERLLVMVAQRLRDVVEPGMTLALLEGDKFAVVAPHDGSETALVAFAERLLRGVSGVYGLPSGDIVLTASIGITSTSEAAAEPAALVRDASTALHRAKEAGRARYEMFEPRMHRRMLGRLSLATDLRRAVDREQLEIAFQPFVSLVDGRVNGAEALLRWNHATRGWIPPDELVPVAIESGLMREIGRGVLLETCRQLARWDADPGTRLDYVTVNVSDQELRDDTFVADVSTALERSGVAARRLVVELRETVLVEHGSPGVGTLEALRDLGVRLLLDEFGSGRASLRHLRDSPVSAVKMDRAVVSGLHDAADKRHIVEAIVGMTTALGLDIVAGGVESADEVRWLRQLGCSVGQGELFSKPLPAPRLADLLRAGAPAGPQDAYGPVEQRSATRTDTKSWLRGEDSSITLGEAAQIIGASPSTVRRWADSGRIRVVRTAGGHRRLARADVDRIAGGNVTPPQLRGSDGDGDAAPAAANVIASGGAAMAAAVARSIYEADAPGWLGSAPSAPAFERWVLALVAALRAGDDESVAGAAQGLYADARAAGVRLVEIDAFLGQYAGEVMRGLAARGAGSDELRAARRRFAQIRRGLLERSERE